MKRFWSNTIEQKAATSWYKRTLTAFSENSTNLLGHLFDKFVRTPELQFDENIGLSYDSVSDSLVMKLNSGTYDLNEKFDGKVDGPASSTDNAIPRFDGTTGKLLQDGGSITNLDTGEVGIGTITPTEKLDVVGNIKVSGTVDGRDVATDGLKLDGIESGAQVNVNADWNSASGDSKILNKPTDITDLSTHASSELSDGADLVKGPASSTVGYIAVADDTSGKSIKYVPVTVDDSGNVVIPGNATINGTLTTINSETLQVKDKNIEIAKVDTPTDDTADGGGITLLGATNKTITWIKSKLSWVFNQAVEIAGNLNVIGNIAVSGTVDGRDVSADGLKLDTTVVGPASSTANTVPVYADETGKLLGGSSVTVVGNNMKPQLVSFKTPSELTGTNAMDFNLNQNWIVYLSGATTTITMTPITASSVFTCNIEVVQDATGGRDLVLVDVDGKAIVNTQEFNFTSGGANERCFITIKYWVTGYRYLVDKYI